MKRLVNWNDTEMQRCQDMPHALETVAVYAQRQGLTGDQAALAAALRERVAVGDVTLAAGLVNPHAKSSCVKHSALIYINFGTEARPRTLGFDRMMVTLLPERPDAEDVQEMKAWYRALADETMLAHLANGTEQEIRSLVLEEGES